MSWRLKRAARVALKIVATVVDPLFGRLRGPRILVYHQVGVNFGREMEVSTQTFTRQLDWMQDNGEIVSLESAIERAAETGAHKLFVLTFDDGFADVYHNAFPLMKQRGIPFTLYLTTRPIETGEPLDPRYPNAKPMTWDQVNEMIGAGLVTIGAHTHTHPDLRDLVTDQIAEELDASNTIIEQRTGRRPKHFTYPWGWWAESADHLVRERYDTATVGWTSPVMPLSDLAVLGRLPIQSSDEIVWFKRRVKTGLRLENMIRRRRSKYAGP